MSHPKKGCLLVTMTISTRIAVIVGLLLASAISSISARSIPKTIIQTSKDKSIDRPDWKEYQHSLKTTNPGFDLVHYDDTEARSFIESHYANTTLVTAYDMVTPIMRADLFRLAVIYQQGGFYMDMDMLAKSSFDPIAAVIDSEQYQAVFPKEWWWSDKVYHDIFPGKDPEDSEDHWQMGQYAFAAVPEHPFIKDVLEEAVVRSVKLMETKGDSMEDISDEDILATTGPYLVTEVFHTGRKQGRYTDVLHMHGDYSESTLQHRHGGVEWHKFGQYAEHMLSHSWMKPENRNLQTYRTDPPTVQPTSSDPAPSLTQRPGGRPTIEPTNRFPSARPTEEPTDAVTNSDPTAKPTNPPTDGSSCKSDDFELELKDKGKKTCTKIKRNRLCNEKVKNPIRNKKRASDFCTICGCGGSFPPTTAPTNGPTDDSSCKSDDFKLELKDKGEKTCVKIKRNSLCNEKVKTAIRDKKRASDFCTICGCGGSFPPTTAPTNAPTDGSSCKSDDSKLKLKDKGKKTCTKIKRNSLCNEKVKKADGNKKTASDFCASCGCECVDTRKEIQLNSGQIKCEDLTTNQCNKKVVRDPDEKRARDYCPKSCQIPGCEIEI